MVVEGDELLPLLLPALELAEAAVELPDPDEDCRAAVVDPLELELLVDEPLVEDDPGIVAKFGNVATCSGSVGGPATPPRAGRGGGVRDTSR